MEEIRFVDYDTSKIHQYGRKLDTIFEYNSDIKKTAYLNWRVKYADTSRSQFVILGEAFFSTAFNLIQQCLADNYDKKADSWIFQILFNIIHGTEVYLKAINAVLSIILDKERKITEGGYDIKGLCSTARNLIIEYKKKNKCDTTELMFQGIKVVEQFVNNIYEKTGDMTFARYPLNKNRQGHFYIQTLENEVIDLELLKEQTIYLFNMLEFIYDMPELDVEMRNELMINYY